MVVSVLSESQSAECHEQIAGESPESFHRYGDFHRIHCGALKGSEGALKGYHQAILGRTGQGQGVVGRKSAGNGAQTSVAQLFEYRCVFRVGRWQWCCRDSSPERGLHPAGTNLQTDIPWQTVLCLSMAAGGAVPTDFKVWFLIVFASQIRRSFPGCDLSKRLKKEVSISSSCPWGVFPMT